jgi:hypothetical protein
MIRRISANNAIRTFGFVLMLSVLIAPVTALWGGCGSGSTPSNTFAELLSLVPAGEAESSSSAYFTMIDNAAAYKDAGITFTTFDELVEKIRALPKDTLYTLPVEGSFITGYGKYAQNTTIQKKYVGYDIGDVDAEIHFGTPPNEGVAAIGRFDPEATNKALSNQDEWPADIKDRYRTEKYKGVFLHSWGDGLKMNIRNKLMPPHLDELGRAKPLAVTDKYLFYHSSLETVKQMIDASLHQGKSLMDLPQYAAIVNYLDGFDVYRMIIGQESVANNCITSIDKEFPGISESEKSKLIEKLGTPLKKFITFGSGYGKDEKGLFIVIVIYHEKSSIAQENVTLLKKHIENDKSLGADTIWSELFTEIDVKADGKILLAKLYRDSGSLSEWAVTQDNLLYHEE